MVAFKGQNDDLRRIGEALGVNHILEGSVRKSGAQVRITAQLIQVDNGFHLWSETYDRELTDVFAIQDEIATEILKQLRSQLLADDVAVAAAKRTNPEVYALYLKAKQRLYTRVGSEIEIAVRELDEAIQLDDEYAPAYAQRGIATMLLSDQQYGSIPHDESNRRGKRFADQALRRLGGARSLLRQRRFGDRCGYRRTRKGPGDQPELHRCQQLAADRLATSGRYARRTGDR